MDSRSLGLRFGGEGDHNDNNDDERNRNETPEMKKTYHRHTPRQIQRMEELFRECAHPDDKQRLQLSEELGLKPHQVKFWFQNRRTQLKAQIDRGDNLMLRAQNEALKNENIRLQAAMEKVVCPRCNAPAVLGEMSFDEQQLRIENARLKEELQRLSSMVGFCDSPLQPQSLDIPEPHQSPLLLDLVMGPYPRVHLGSSSAMSRADDLLQLPSHNPTAQDPAAFTAPLWMMDDNTLVLELAMTAADQLLKLCRTKEPLWVRRNGCFQDALDLAEHARMLPWPVDLKQRPHHGQFRTEATRDGAVVMMNSISLVDSFFDPEKWIELFPSIVAKAETVHVLSPGLSEHGNGRLQLMRVELQFPSPLVPSRQAHFFRYCQRNSGEHMWAVVDFPVDSFRNGVEASSFSSSLFRRRTSGCVVQDMLNGCSKVLWVEHVEVEDNKTLHPIFNQFIRSGAAFGATRWISTLKRQCERQASLATANISDFGAFQSPEERRNLVKLSQRMMRTFCANMISSETQSWTALSNAPDDAMRVTTRVRTGPGQPNGVILSAVSTAWLPFPHEQVFDLLSDGNIWSQLDVLLSGSSLHELNHFANGTNPKNSVSLLRVNYQGDAMNSSQNVDILLKESSTDPSGGSFLLYATIEGNAMQAAIRGQDPSCVPLLPAGFVIKPASSPTPHVGSSAAAGALPWTAKGGSLLTVGVQVLASSTPSAVLDVPTVTAIANHVGKTMQQIITMLGCTLTEPCRVQSSP